MIRSLALNIQSVDRRLEAKGVFALRLQDVHMKDQVEVQGTLSIGRSAPRDRNTG